MLAINDDGGFVLPAGAEQDFTHFLERNGVACVGAGQIRTPFDRAKVQRLYLEWAKRKQGRIRRRLIIAPLVVAALFVVISPLVVLMLFQNRPPPLKQTPASSKSDPPQIPTEVDRILKSLTLGNIAYNTPSSMRCDEKAKIQLLLSPRTAIEELKQKISGLGEKVGEKIRVADVMEADLYGGAFETHALRPKRQAVGGADDTEWQWEVVAKEPGNHELQLIISAILNVNGLEGSKVLKVYYRNIDVHVTLSDMTRTFVANNWQWLFGLVGAIGALVLTWSVGWWRSRGDRRFPNVIAPEVLVGKIKVLLFAANPRGTDPLDLHREFREIDEEIRFGEFRDALELTIVPGTRLVDLLRKLNEAHPDIVHFSGHGNIDEEIILESGEGDPVAPDNTRSSARDMRRLEPVSEAGRACSPRPLGKSALVDIVKACNQENIRVVVLNACHTRPQAEALSEVVDCVISMNRAISDVGAIKFAASFYGALAFGRSVENAFDQGLARLKAEGISASETPELMVRTGVDASTFILVGPRGDAEANKRKVARTHNVAGGRASTRKPTERLRQTLGAWDAEKLFQASNVGSNHEAAKGLLDEVTCLIEKFEAQYDELATILRDSGYASQLYGSAGRVPEDRLLQANRKLITISNEMRAIYRGIDKRFSVSPSLRNAIDSITKTCLQIGVVEDFLVIKGVENSGTLQFDLQKQRDSLHRCTSDFESIVEQGNLSNNSGGELVKTYHNILILIHDYKIALKEAVADLDRHIKQSKADVK